MNSASSSEGEVICVICLLHEEGQNLICVTCLLHEEGQEHIRTRRRSPVRNMLKKKMFPAVFLSFYVDMLENGQGVAFSDGLQKVYDSS